MKHRLRQEREHLVQVVDQLLEQVEELRRCYAELAEFVDEPERDATGEREAAAQSQPPAPDPIRLIAIDMALAGNTREEVDTYVRGAYGVTPDPEMLDGVFKQVLG